MEARVHKRFRSLVIVCFLLAVQSCECRRKCVDNADCNAGAVCLDDGNSANGHCYFK